MPPTRAMALSRAAESYWKFLSLLLSEVLGIGRSLSISSPSRISVFTIFHEVQSCSSYGFHFSSGDFLRLRFRKNQVTTASELSLYIGLGFPRPGRLSPSASSGATIIYVMYCNICMYVCMLCTYVCVQVSIYICNTRNICM